MEEKILDRNVTLVGQLLFFGSILSLLSPNPILTLLSIWTLYISYKLLWRENSFNMLFFMVALQWVYVSIKIFYADIEFLDIIDVSGAGLIWKATFLSLIGLLFLALGMHIFNKKNKSFSKEDLDLIIQPMKISQLFKAYIYSLGFTIFLGPVIWRFPGLTQLLLPLTNIKYIFAFLALAVIFYKKRNYSLALLIILIETIIGITGFFAEFTTIYIILFIVYITANLNKVHGKVLRRAGMIVLILITFLIIWTAIKPEYREFVNGGFGDQQVRASFTDRITTIVQLTFDLDGLKINDASDALVNRISQTKYFAEVVEQVPQRVSYEKGKLWGSVIKHVITPRIIFKNKAAISDSARSNPYLINKVAGVSGGTSISLGYMAESYIDFGPYLMFIPIFLVGLIYSFVEFLILRRSKYLITGFALSMIILFPGIFYETSNIKLVGLLITNFITLYTLFILFENKLYAYLTK